MPPLLSVSGISIEFTQAGPRRSVVSDLSFEIPAGAALGLVGESGAGKSLTALAIERLLPSGARVVSGEIVYAGRNLLSLPEGEMCTVRGGEIGFVFQDPLLSLDPVVPVGRQVAEAVRLHRPSLARRAVRDRCRELLEEVGMPDASHRLQQYPHELSGGMRQRILLAAALAGDPQLLIADEPTSSLDPLLRGHVLDLLARLRQQRGLALLLVTHDLAAAVSACDRIGVMYAGRLVEDSPAAVFATRPLHPYSRALQACVPALPDATGSRPRRFPAIPGSAAAPGGFPDELCAYVARCPDAFDECRKRLPPLFAVGASRARCFLWER